LFESGRAKFLNATDDEALAAAFELAKLEGIIPALESAHALSCLTLLSLSEGEGGQATANGLSSGANKSSLKIDEQMKVGKNSIVVVCLSGRGDKDLQAYMNKMEEKK
jgi:tryptophan synthase beta chain